MYQKHEQIEQGNGFEAGFDTATSLPTFPIPPSGDDTKLLHDRATGGCLPRETTCFSYYFS